MDLTVLQREWDEAASQWAQVWPQVIARAWSDDEFKGKLLGDPKNVLAAEYKELPLLQNLCLKVVEEGSTLGPVGLPETMALWLVLPQKPSDLQTEALKQVITRQGGGGGPPPPPTGGGGTGSSCC